MVTGRPQETEAASYYFTYINQVEGEDPLGAIVSQLDEAAAFFKGIGEEQSLFRYAPEKWSMREALSHITDTERAFAFRALWFARGFDAPLPGFDQNAAATGAQADRIPWAQHLEEFRQVRESTISFFRHLPEDGWLRGGIASDNFVTVRALSYIIPGHVAHHLEILRTRYR